MYRKALIIRWLKLTIYVREAGFGDAVEFVVFPHGSRTAHRSPQQAEQEDYQPS